jgi:anti-anti-sigma factor
VSGSVAVVDSHSVHLSNDVHPLGGPPIRRESSKVIPSRHANGWLLTITGELDPLTVSCVQEVLDRWLIGADHLIVDLGGLTFIDATGLSVLTDALNMGGGRIQLSGITDETAHLLDTSGHGGVFLTDVV